MLLEALRHKDTKGFGAVIFRRDYNQITAEGGLWDASQKMYSGIPGAKPVKSPKLHWSFGRGKGKINFAHLKRDENLRSWQGTEICLLAFDELTHFCLHPNTEVLTASGWKKITDVKIGEYVPSRNINGTIELKKVLSVPFFDYEGDLISVYQKHGLAVDMTPNHRVPVESQARNSNQKTHRFISAEHLLKKNENVARAGDWNSEKEIEWYSLKQISGRGIGRNANIASKVRMDDWLEFLGWYLSEGSSFLAAKSRGGTSPCVSIRQTKPNDSLKRLMERLPWRVRPDGDGGYRIYSRQLFEEVHPLGNLYEKRIPRFVFTLSKRQQWILFDAFMQGDGYKTPYHSYYVGLANEGLIDDLQEMAVYLGRIATKGIDQTKDGFTVYRLNVQDSSHSQFTHIKPRSVTKVPYKGKVYCLTVEDNHTFMIRYKNRISWTGNSRKQFLYMLSRNRSTCGIHPYVRATCNPDADSWVADLIAWWINQDTGYAIPERSGKIRYMTVLNDQIYMEDTKEALVDKTGVEPDECKSITFISAKLSDNKVLMETDPGYLANLKAMLEVDRERLLNGNWKIKPAAGMFFKRSQVQILDSVPDDVYTWARGWDLAATPDDADGDPDFTAGVLIGKRRCGRYVVADVIHFRSAAAEVRTTLQNTCRVDRAAHGPVTEHLPQDPGQAGKAQAASFLQLLAGYIINIKPESGSKLTRAEPFAVQWQHGNVDIVAAPWNEKYLSELESFPESKHDDMVDASSSAFYELEARTPAKPPRSITQESYWRGR